MGNDRGLGVGPEPVLDYLITDSDVDGKKVAVFGHSRNGKTAPVAALERTSPSRFLATGCGGTTAPSRSTVGESVSASTPSFRIGSTTRFQNLIAT